MNALSPYCIQIISLKNQNYQYQYDIHSDFFSNFENSTVEKGSLKCFLSLDKTDNYINMAFVTEGSVELICDRSLDAFDYPVNINNNILFKYSEEDQVIDDEVELISRNRQEINVAQYIYEFIATAIPLKKLHPRFDDDDDQNELIYSTSTEKDQEKENKKEEDDIDPRWKSLIKLRNQLN